MTFPELLLVLVTFFGLFFTTLGLGLGLIRVCEWFRERKREVEP